MDGSSLLKRLRDLTLAFVFSFSQAAHARTHDYRVTVSEDLSTLTVVGRLDGVVRSVAARDDGAVAVLRAARLCNSEAPLPLRRGRLRLPDAADPCIRYDVSLDSPLEQGHGGWWNQAPLEDQLVSPALWLWRPSLDDNTTIQVSFKLPGNTRVSVPWEPIAGEARQRFRFGNSPRSSRALSVFGQFDYREVPVPGAVLRVSLLRGSEPMDNDSIIRWLEAAATNVTLAHGTFPNPLPQVVVVPVGPRSEPVPFGRVIRDGGEAVQFFIDPTRPLEEFLADWTATHEFSHLLLPYVGDRWASEGFATYYQNVLLARGGVYTEQRAWQRLHEGFGRGRRSSPGVSPNDASMRNGGVMKIYWSGAAMALLGDIRLRQRSEGRESIDTVLRRLHECCLPSARSWSARELFEKLDALSGYPVFVELYRRYANAPEFPDVEGAFQALGLSVGSDGQVRLAGSGGQVALRQAIMRPDSEIAAVREKPGPGTSATRD